MLVVGAAVVVVLVVGAAVVVVLVVGVQWYWYWWGFKWWQYSPPCDAFFAREREKL